MIRTPSHHTTRTPSHPTNYGPEITTRPTDAKSPHDPDLRHHTTRTPVTTDPLIPRSRNRITPYQCNRFHGTQITTRPIPRFPPLTWTTVRRAFSPLVPVLTIPQIPPHYTSGPIPCDHLPPGPHIQWTLVLWTPLLGPDHW